jgi:hypothetical protein
MPNIYYTTPATTISYKTTKPYETTPVVTTIPYTTTPVVTTRVATTTPVATTRAVSFRDGMVVYYTFDSDNFDLTNNKIKNKVTNTFDAGVDGGGNSSTNPKIGNGCFDLAGRVIWFDTGVKYGTNGFTISFWFKGSFDSMGMNGNQSCLYGSSTADITTDANLFTIFMNCNANNAAVSSNYDKGKMAVFYNNSAGRAGDIGTTGYKYKFDSGMVSFPKDTWTHFALTVTYDSGTNALYTMYFNGNPVNTMRGAYPLDAPAASIGRQANGGGWRSGPGAFMDNFAIHNRVLTPSQITALYNMTTNII